jgi:MHS family alpha-ketoglutarate permease-like MFS transporter
MVGYAAMGTSVAEGSSNTEGLGSARRRLRAVIVGSLGNLVEWYDFYAYAAFGLYFAGSFFPEGDPVAQQLSVALVFAFGFLVRPVGGWWFGRMADRHGRRRALTVSVLLMCLGSLLIALTPTHAQIGRGAPVLLVLARVLQGLSLGGEYGASATYLSEVADPARRGFYSSFQYVTLLGGQLLAMLVLLLLQRVLLDEEQLRAWGWRIPFVIGALFALVTALMRKELHESEQFQALKAKPAGATGLRGLLAHPREVAIVVGLTAGGTAAFYTYTTYMQKFLKLSVGLSDNETTEVSAAALVFAMLLQPVYGALSDRIGRKWLLVGFGVLGTLFTAPLLYTLEHTRSALGAFLLLCAAWLIVSGYTSINAVVKAELFPTRVRATGVGLPYAVTVSLFGGTVEAIALSFKRAGHERWFYFYLTGCIALSLLVYVGMRDTKQHSAIAEDG